MFEFVYTFIFISGLRVEGPFVLVAGSLQTAVMVAASMLLFSKLRRTDDMFKMSRELLLVGSSALLAFGTPSPAIYYYTADGAFFFLWFTCQRLQSAIYSVHTAVVLL